MEDVAGWHGKTPNYEEMQKGLAELGVAEKIPVRRLLEKANAFQAQTEHKLEAKMPKFRKNYWWNAADTMKVKMEPTRMGFGKSLAENGDDERIVCLGLDISGSITISQFYAGKPERKKRWISMGIAEQSATSAAAGLGEREANSPSSGPTGLLQRRAIWTKFGPPSVTGISTCSLRARMIHLGALLSDIPAAEVYQRHREPLSWRWQEDGDYQSYVVDEPKKIVGPPALVLSLSATIVDERILKIIPNASIWKVSVPTPHNDFLKSRRQASEFRLVMRQTMDKIKALHGQDATIHIFPAMPVALAVELGRIRMPKADLPFAIYDEDRVNGGFRYALSIGADPNA